MMKSDAPLDFAVFRLSPKRSHCELFVSSDGNIEKLASGLLKPFVSHLKIAEEQVASASQTVRLEVGRRKNAEPWFTKGTIERFVRFVSTPEVLELVNTYDAEVSQLEAARRIYSQGGGDKLPGVGGSSTSDDATKKELLRAIDVRLVAVQQDLSSAYGRATAAGFNIDTVSELQMFADRFGAHRLKGACSKFVTLCERRPNLVNLRYSGNDDRAVRSSCGSDMSIDDDPHSLPSFQESLHQSNSYSTTLPLHRSFSRESSVERDDAKRANEAIPEKDKTDDIPALGQTEPSRSNQSTRRLSVQDRINMFENKQKENSGGKSVVVKSMELRRMSSDVSSAGADKAVLRRWSGASDMSLDLGSDKKDDETTLSTPFSSLLSQEGKASHSNDDGTMSSCSTSKQEIKTIPSSDSVNEGGIIEGSSITSESRTLKMDFVPGDSDRSKDQMHGKTNSRMSYNLEDFEDKLNNMISGRNREGINAVIFGDRGKSKMPLSVGEYSEPRSQTDEINDHGSSPKRDRPLKSNESGHGETLNRREDYLEETVMPTRLKPRRATVGESLVSESVSGSRIREAFAAHCKGSEGDSSSNQKEMRPIHETEAVKESELQASDKASSVSVASSEDSRGLKKKYFSSQGSSTDRGKNPKARHDEPSLNANVKVPFPGQIIAEAKDGFDSFSTPPPEQSQRLSQSKGNQELHDELKMKANELEKLFAEHKRRVPGEQSYSSSHKGKSENVPQEPTGSSHYYSTPLSDSQVFSDSYPSSAIKNSKTKLNNAVPLMNKGESQKSGDALRKNFAELSVSEGSRGKLYVRYMQRRDAKLREDWNSNRAEKEAQLKFMHDTLERSRSEMRDKFSGSLDVQDSVSSARRRAERLRSYNSRSIMKKEQQSLDFGDSEDDEALDLLEKRITQEDKALDDSSIMDSVSRGVRGKRHISDSKNASSSTPRTLLAPASRSAVRNPSANSGKRRTLRPENPLAQSVPNFSDLRKENTKPQEGIKAARSQTRNYSRSKITGEEASLSKEENRSRRSQATREISPDGCAVSTPIGFNDDIPDSTNTKPFLKKGSRARYVSQANIAKQKISVEPEPMNNMEENDEFTSATDEITSAVKYEEEEEEFETSNAAVHKTLDTSETTVRLGSDKFVHSESENGDGASSMFSRVDQALGTQLPSESFLTANSVQDWPVESPVSWASHAQHPFSYTHETSDVDAYAESPIGSVASWNSHSMNQMENDAANAARMRRKWGAAQKPTLITQSSNQSSPRKDMTRGFKRLLRFGRKNRASEGFADWVSATTSEGDDDTEDGRDLIGANRSSEDLRKSRMGFNAHGQQHSEDNFNDSEFDNESVQSSHPTISSNFKLREDHMSGSSVKTPRSFFSFMSKGSESKAR